MTKLLIKKKIYIQATAPLFELLFPKLPQFHSHLLEASTDYIIPYGISDRITLIFPQQNTKPPGRCLRRNTHHYQNKTAFQKAIKYSVHMSQPHHSKRVTSEHQPCEGKSLTRHNVSPCVKASRGKGKRENKPQLQ